MGRHLFFSGGAHGGFRWSEGDALGIWWTCDLLMRAYFSTASFVACPSACVRPSSFSFLAFTTFRYVRLLFAGRG
jgi:hypothetical protein